MPEGRKTPSRLGSENSAIAKAFNLVNRSSGQFAMTDLTRTDFESVVGRYFRFFVPIKTARMRLPTSLPEFWSLRHRATLSDSPVTASHHLGGHWTDHNLAAITHVAACNLRCSYCYVPYPLLSGRDSFVASPGDIASAFVRIQAELARDGRRLSILRISGGEPLLAPRLVIGVFAELDHLAVFSQCVLKVESNASVLPYSLARLSNGELSELASIAPRTILHVTIHAAPGTPNWSMIRDGLTAAADIGFDLYPAIGGADWSAEDMNACFEALVAIRPNLPFRLAVRPFNLDYPALRGRRKLPRAKPGEEEASLLWERILQIRTGTAYLAKPRHLMELPG